MSTTRTASTIPSTFVATEATVDQLALAITITNNRALAAGPGSAGATRAMNLRETFRAELTRRGWVARADGLGGHYALTLAEHARTLDAWMAARMAGRA